MSAINSPELKPNETSGSYIVSYDFRGQDTDVLIVGKMSDGGMTVTNAFQGQEAHDLLNSLTTVKSNAANLVDHLEEPEPTKTHDFTGPTCGYVMKEI